MTPPLPKGNAHENAFDCALGSLAFFLCKNYAGLSLWLKKLEKLEKGLNIWIVYSEYRKDYEECIFADNINLCLELTIWTKNTTWY